MWSNVTNYGDCLCNSTIECPAANGVHEDDHDSPAALEISVIIYLIGNDDETQNILTRKCLLNVKSSVHIAKNSRRKSELL